MEKHLNKRCPSSDKLKQEYLDKEWLSLIIKAKELGISLSEIKEFLRNHSSAIQEHR
jgi:DNA-binding transcriptional MerR regulator